MIRIAIVEDSQDTSQSLQKLIERYGREHGKSFHCTCFANGVDFITDYTPQYDLVFMDIDMPLLNGMETAKLLRKHDSDVALIFVTNLEKYAIFGYDVGALGFIVKPLTYAMLSVKLSRFLASRRERSEPYLVVTSKSGVVKVNLSDVYHISVNGRYVKLHTRNGEIEYHKSMKQLEKELGQYNFVRCDNSSMVNLKYVSAVNCQEAVVNDVTIPCSRNGRRVLMDAFTLYLR